MARWRLQSLRENKKYSLRGLLIYFITAIGFLLG